MTPHDVILLPSNQPAERFYLGGSQISALRGEPESGPNTPEDWIASTTSVRGQSPIGLTILPGGGTLAEAIERDPEAWLGSAHLRAFGVDTKLLVKLLDAGQRLPVHAHPDTSFARATLGTAHGKAEAWYLLSAGEVFLGLQREVTVADLQGLVEAQDSEALLRLLHRIPVTAGQTVYVPPGVLHAVGEGILLAEVQEPEDLSILLEWRDFDLDGARDGHLGLGFEVALQAVETRARSVEEIAALVTDGDELATVGGSILAKPSVDFFRFERHHVGSHPDHIEAQDSTATVRVEPGFAVLLVVAGALVLETEHGDAPVRAPRGTTAVLPNSAGHVTISGAGTILIARPPIPRAESAS